VRRFIFEATKKLKREINAPGQACCGQQQISLLLWVPQAFQRLPIFAREPASITA
jgi:hypothetical protein